MTSHDYKMHLYNNFKICEQTYLLRTYENREVLANLKTDSNKNLARSHFSTYVLTLPTSEELQTLIKYFETFLSTSLGSFHLKWKNESIITTNWMYELHHKLSNDIQYGKSVVKSRNWVHR